MVVVVLVVAVAVAVVVGVVVVVAVVAVRRGLGMSSSSLSVVVVVAFVVRQLATKPLSSTQDTRSLQDQFPHNLTESPVDQESHIDATFFPSFPEISKGFALAKLLRRLKIGKDIQSKTRNRRA